MTKSSRHASLKEYLVNSIVGEMLESSAAGKDEIPSEHQLCERFNVSRNTVRRALLAISEQGFIESRHGSGWKIVRKSDGKLKKMAVIGNAEMPIVGQTGREILKLSLNSAFACEFIPLNVQRLDTFKGNMNLSGLSGMIVLSGTSMHENLVCELRTGKIPYIYGFYCGCEGGFSSVSVDHGECVRSLFRKMQASGNRRIAFFNRDIPADPSFKTRADTYLRTCMETGSQNLLLTVEEDFWMHDRKIENTLDFIRVSGVDSIICTTLMVASELVYILARNSIRVPQNLSVAGIGNDYYFPQFVRHAGLSGITRMEFNLKIIAKKLFEMIAGTINGADTSEGITLTEPKFVDDGTIDKK
ncbi:MAG TPA: hypothetical protein DET40_22035 [Lentisphaeria bacterium]|nr:MAG: hypothetical protein A2X45_04125 [Lentisphaerae bacterium GWF2_50_93]HCE46234.1 hypothetical protein [Lentisphaeria bacterium]